MRAFWQRTVTKLLLGSLVCGLWWLLLNGCASPPPPPPPARVELRPPRPAPRAVWVPGHWQWKGRRRGYVWVPGHWRRR